MFVHRFSGYGLVDIHVVLHVLGHLGRFISLGVISRFNVVPGQFAQTLEPKPGTEHGEVVQGFSFVLESGDVVVYHIHKDQPGFVVLGTLEGKSIATLLRQGFFAHILGIFQTFGFHADVLQELGISAILLGKDLLHAAHTLTHDETKAFSARHLVE